MLTSVHIEIINTRFPSVASEVTKRMGIAKQAQTGADLLQDTTKLAQRVKMPGVTN